jgi:hypothetical protein
MRVLAGAFVAAMCLMATPARAASDVDSKARAHFEAGKAHYGAGNFEAALQEFTAGYDISGRPQFLINIGHASRKLGRLEAARTAFQLYLEKSPPTDPKRDEVQRLFREVNLELSLRPPSVQTSPQTATVTQTESPSWLRRNWWVVALGTVAAGGAAFGIYKVTRGPPTLDASACGTYTLGCVDVSR